MVAATMSWHVIVADGSCHNVMACHCRMVWSAIISHTLIVTQLLMWSSLHYTNMVQRGIWCCPHLIHHYVQCEVLITSLISKWLSLQVTIEAATNPSLLLNTSQLTKILHSCWCERSFSIWCSCFCKISELYGVYIISTSICSIIRVFWQLLSRVQLKTTQIPIILLHSSVLLYYIIHSSFLIHPPSVEDGHTFILPIR